MSSVKEYTTLTLQTKEQVQEYLDQYGVHSVDELSSLLYSRHHIQVVDLTEESEYTQDNAQNSSAFAEEGFSLSEFEEAQQLRDIYR